MLSISLLISAIVAAVTIISYVVKNYSDPEKAKDATKILEATINSLKEGKAFVAESADTKQLTENIAALQTQLDQSAGPIADYVALSTATKTALGLPPDTTVPMILAKINEKLTNLRTTSDQLATANNTVSSIITKLGLSANASPNTILDTITTASGTVSECSQQLLALRNQMSSIAQAGQETSTDTAVVVNNIVAKLNNLAHLLLDVADVKKSAGLTEAATIAELKSAIAAQTASSSKYLSLLTNIFSSSGKPATKTNDPDPITTNATSVIDLLQTNIATLAQKTAIIASVRTALVMDAAQDDSTIAAILAQKIAALTADGSLLTSIKTSLGNGSMPNSAVMNSLVTQLNQTNTFVSTVYALIDPTAVNVTPAMLTSKIQSYIDQGKVALGITTSGGTLESIMTSLKTKAAGMVSLVSGIVSAQKREAVNPPTDPPTDNTSLLNKINIYVDAYNTLSSYSEQISAINTLAGTLIQTSGNPLVAIQDKMTSFMTSASALVKTVGTGNLDIIMNSLRRITSDVNRYWGAVDPSRGNVYDPILNGSDLLAKITEYKNAANQLTVTNTIIQSMYSLAGGTLASTADNLNSTLTSFMTGMKAKLNPALASLTFDVIQSEVQGLIDHIKTIRSSSGLSSDIYDKTTLTTLIGKMYTSYNTLRTLNTTYGLGAEAAVTDLVNAIKASNICPDCPVCTVCQECQQCPVCQQCPPISTESLYSMSYTIFSNYNSKMMVYDPITTRIKMYAGQVIPTYPNASNGALIFNSNGTFMNGETGKCFTATTTNPLLVEATCNALDPAQKFSHSSGSIYHVGTNQAVLFDASTSAMMVSSYCNNNSDPRCAWTLFPADFIRKTIPNSITVSAETIGVVNFRAIFSFRKISQTYFGPCMQVAVEDATVSGGIKYINIEYVAGAFGSLVDLASLSIIVKTYPLVRMAKWFDQSNFKYYMACSGLAFANMPIIGINGVMRLDGGLMPCIQLDATPTTSLVVYNPNSTSTASFTISPDVTMGIVYRFRDTLAAAPTIKTKNITSIMLYNTADQGYTNLQTKNINGSAFPLSFKGLSPTVGPKNNTSTNILMFQNNASSGNYKLWSHELVTATNPPYYNTIAVNMASNNSSYTVATNSKTLHIDNLMFNTDVEKYNINIYEIIISVNTGVSEASFMPFYTSARVYYGIT